MGHPWLLLWTQVRAQVRLFAMEEVWVVERVTEGVSSWKPILASVAALLSLPSQLEAVAPPF